jgi:hypothetical protein
MIALDRRPLPVITFNAPTTDETFRALGTDVRLIATGAGARAAVARARAEILEYHARLSRFLPASEISALNSDPRPVVPASALLRSAVRAGLWAARHSGGLVDPCLLDALEASGYERSFELAEQCPHHQAHPGPQLPIQHLAGAPWTSTTAPAPSVVRPVCASTWVARGRGTRPTSSRDTSLRCASGSSTAAVTSAWAALARSRSPTHWSLSQRGDWARSWAPSPPRA